MDKFIFSGNSRGGPSGPPEWPGADNSLAAQGSETITSTDQDFEGLRAGEREERRSVNSIRGRFYSESYSHAEESMDYVTSALQGFDDLQIAGNDGNRYDLPREKTDSLADTLIEFASLQIDDDEGPDCRRGRFIINLKNEPLRIMVTMFGSTTREYNQQYTRSFSWLPENRFRA